MKWNCLGCVLIKLLKKAQKTFRFDENCKVTDIISSAPLKTHVKKKTTSSYSIIIFPKSIKIEKNKKVLSDKLTKDKTVSIKIFNASNLKNQIITIITLNINDLNTPITRPRFSD